MAEWLRREDGFTMIAHVSPDGDTIGSSLAIYALLLGMGKRARLVCEHIVPPLYAFMPFAERFQKPEKCEGDYPNAIAVDCATRDRMGAALALYEQAKNKGNIDHHLSNEQFGEYILHDANASATGELVYLLLRELQPPLRKELQVQIAECLFVAISTDTGNFAYSNTTPRSLRISADLLEMGVDIAELNRKVYRTVPIGKTRLRGYVLSSMELYENARIGVAVIMFKDLRRAGACVEDIEGMVDGVRDVDTVEVAILIREKKDGGFKASLRSKRIADVSAIAGKFGGGGHLRAAGCNSGSRPAEEFKRALIAAAKDALR